MYPGDSETDMWCFRVMKNRFRLMGSISGCSQTMTNDGQIVTHNFFFRFHIIMKSIVSFPSILKIEFESESCWSENIYCNKFLERLVTFIRAGVGKGHVT